MATDEANVTGWYELISRHGERQFLFLVVLGRSALPGHGGATLAELRELYESSGGRVQRLVAPFEERAEATDEARGFEEIGREVERLWQRAQQEKHVHARLGQDVDTLMTWGSEARRAARRLGAEWQRSG